MHQKAESKKFEPTFNGRNEQTKVTILQPFLKKIKNDRTTKYC